MTMQKSTPVLEIKALDEKGTFEGYGSVFNHTDSHRDRVLPGAFVQSLADAKRKGSRIKMFWQHRSDEPLGKWTDMAEDAKGLWVEGKLNMDVQRAREAYALLKEGDIDGLSIGYWPEEWEEDKDRPGVMLLKKVRLVEVSIVSMGSNDRALVSDVKNEIERAGDWAAMRQKLVAGEPLTIRELERGVREAFNLSGSEAERAARACFKIALGEPETAAQSAELDALLKLRQHLGLGDTTTI